MGLHQQTCVKNSPQSENTDYSVQRVLRAGVSKEDHAGNLSQHHWIHPNRFP